MAPATRTVVHLLRHGEVHNPQKILYGRLPGYRLSDAGRAMADGIADHLAGSDITYLAASSLTRAQETRHAERRCSGCRSPPTTG